MSREDADQNIKPFVNSFENKKNTPVTLGTAAFLAVFTVRNCNAAPHKRGNSSSPWTLSKTNPRPQTRNKNQFESRPDAVTGFSFPLPSGSLALSRSGATCLAVAQVMRQKSAFQSDLCRMIVFS